MHSGSPSPSLSSTGDRPTVVVGNAEDATRRIRVRRRRDGREATDAAALAAGATRALAVPDGTGPATVEFYTARTAATMTFDPATARLPPLLALRDGGVVVARY